MWAEDHSEFGPPPFPTPTQPKQQQPTSEVTTWASDGLLSVKVLECLLLPWFALLVTDRSGYSPHTLWSEIRFCVYSFCVSICLFSLVNVFELDLSVGVRLKEPKRGRLLESPIGALHLSEHFCSSYFRCNRLKRFICYDFLVLFCIHPRFFIILLSYL